jgi:hypothetical protein
MFNDAFFKSDTFLTIYPIAKAYKEIFIFDFREIRSYGPGYLKTPGE